MEILIVAKTHMAHSSCVGGLELITKTNVRLLNSDGENQPKENEFEVGQIWDIKYSPRTNTIAPHIEDIIIENKRFIRTQPALNTFLRNNASVWSGPPENIFQGKLHFETGHSGYATQQIGTPDQSVGFWLPDTELELTILDDRRHFYYFDMLQGPRIYAFPYVGFAPIVEKIPLGNLVRVSLARWWSPDPENRERRCYCQLSGWYAD